MSPLSVPLFRQEIDSVVCGPVAIRMLLEYYGISISAKEIATAVKIHKTFGTFTPQWGVYLDDLGFETEIITQNPRLFTAKDRSRKNSHLRTVLAERLQKARLSLDKKAIQSYIDYIDAGGKLTVKIPDEKDIRDEIRNKRPLLAELTSNWLLGKRRGFNFHFNVITGIDSKNIYVNDPLPDSTGGKQQYNIQDFLLAMYASSHGTPDEGALMKIKLKGRQK